MRDRPVPIPAPGIQLVALSHVEDVASMLAKVSLSTITFSLSDCDVKHSMLCVVNNWLARRDS